jgi:hypothetical protein
VVGAEARVRTLGRVEENEDSCLSFVQTWGEAVIRQIGRVRTERKRFDEVDRAYDRMEEWSPTEFDLQRSWRALWAEEHTLILAAYQLERWTRRLAHERRQDPPAEDVVLASVRNVLEHLDEVEFEGVYAVPGQKRSNPSLRKLPDGRLAIALGAHKVFGLIAPEQLERRALAIVHKIQDELEAGYEDWFLEPNRPD